MKASALGGVVVAWDALRVVFAFEPSRFADVLAFAIRATSENEGREEGANRNDSAASGEGPASPSWCVGLAEGELVSSPLGSRSPSSDEDLSGGFAWGPPLVAASLLAGVARPGEILCASSVRAFAKGELVTDGGRIARDGELRIRGARIDRQQPWRKVAVDQLARMRTAPLVGRPLPKIDVRPGALVLLRADPGTGGSRALSELAAASPRALVVSPVGSGYEPLGALRRAIGRSITRDVSPMLLELTASLDSLLAGNGASIDQSAQLASALLWPKTAAKVPGVLVIDDAKTVDPATLDACVRAVRSAVSFGLVVRLDATGGLPSVLATLPKIDELELHPLSREASESLAGACTSDALDAKARSRWARLGGGLPLAIVEAIACGISGGEIVWSGDRGRPRSRRSGRGKVRAATDWIGLRARDETLACKTVLCLLALLGGEAKLPRLASILEAAGHRLDVETIVAELIRSRWLLDTEEDWVGLPSRTHREALSRILDDGQKRALHLAIADVVERDEGIFGRVEAGWHAAQAQDRARAARVLLASAKATAEVGLESSTTQLIAFARRIDPSCEEAALELLANALERSPSVGPDAARLPSVAPPRPPTLAPPPARSSASSVAAPSAAHDEPDSMVERALIVPPDRRPATLIPPTSRDASPSSVMTAARDLGAAFAADEQAPSRRQSGPPLSASAPGSQIAMRLGELAREALLAADNAALERWVDGLRAAGESPVFTERMRAMARLGRGDIGDALRVLRRARSSLSSTDHALRCQTSLALAVALSVASRPQEALLEAMDALARARQINDERGAKACLAFLAKLYTAVSRPTEADKLRASSAI